MDAVSPPSEVSAEQVATYLKAHPDFLQRRADLLATLEVHHASGSAVSLIERQVELLRNKNAQLEDRLAQVLSNANDNERRGALIHKLARTLIRAPSLAAAVAGLMRVMREDFNISEAIVAINAAVYKRQDIEGLYPLEPDSLLSRSTEGFLRTKLVECGPISAERARALFPRAAAPVLSAALVPLEKDRNLGFIALGAYDDSRFQPRQGRLFLELTAELVSAALRARLG